MARSKFCVGDIVEVNSGSLTGTVAAIREARILAWLIDVSFWYPNKEEFHVVTFWEEMLRKVNNT